MSFGAKLHLEHSEILTLNCELRICIITATLNKKACISEIFWEILLFWVKFSSLFHLTIFSVSRTGNWTCNMSNDKQFFWLETVYWVPWYITQSPFSCKWQDFIFLYRWITLHCVYMCINTHTHTHTHTHILTLCQIKSWRRFSPILQAVSSLCCYTEAFQFAVIPFVIL